MSTQMRSQVPPSRRMGAKEGIRRTYEEHQDLLIFALTGRTGSGCTTAANLLAEEYQPKLAAHFRPEGPERAKHKIIQDYARPNWTPFSKITVSSLLITFLAEEENELDALNSSIDPLRRLEESELSEVKQIVAEARSCVQDLLKILALNPHEFASYNFERSPEVKAQIVFSLSGLLSEMRKCLGRKYNAFLQEVGDNIRKSGTASKRALDPDKLFELPRRIVRAIECIRAVDKVSGVKTRIVLDAIRNPLELMYIRDHYSPLYAVAITADDRDRVSRLLASNYTQDSISAIDEREYPKKYDPYASYDALVTQDIQGCLQKADIFISNPGSSEPSRSARRARQGALYSQLLKYCILALHPGLVTPTRDERCMQVAFTAKANSGCISRQVGAAVTDAFYGIKAIGWNDVPRGQIPCALRNVDDLMMATDVVAYSELERESDQLRSHVDKKYGERRSALGSVGLPCTYCFKDAANESILMKGGNKGSNQVHTRSLHAEENAFLQLTAGAALLRGGKLFTTASPCELCSKKAFQLGVEDIVYIDPYPGISVPHVISSGDLKMRPRVRLYSGAVGKAYHRIYEPMIPIKDEIMARLS